MTNAKKGKKASADAVYAKKAGKKGNPFESGAASNKKINPFEVHINKEKFNILGRTCKHDKGLPGVSRAKANKKRKETLEKEYKHQNKSNQFRDRRIGGHLTGDDLTEDVMNARFLAEKMSQMKQGKVSRFNLNDDEILTHRGQTIGDIEQFHDDRSDDGDENDEMLDADFTEAAHFGGDGAEGRDRKTAIEEMIIEQKRRKNEIAKEKDEVHDLTQKLDSNYKELLTLVGKLSKGDDEKTKPPPDDYDKAMREMIFEPRGEVSDKLLTEEEQAKQEKERLEEMELERKRRMMGLEGDKENDDKPKHRSADELDDSYFAVGEITDNPTLTYNLEGELQVGQQQNDIEEEENAEDNDDDDNDDDDNDDDNEEAAEEEEKNSSDDEEEDNMSDLKATDSEDEEQDEKQVNVKVVEKKTKTKNNERTDLPFTIEMPTTYAQLKSLLDEHIPTDQGIIVERILKCNHPKLEAANREKIVKLFAFLLEYINEHFSDTSVDNIGEHFKLLNALNPHMYDLVQLQTEKMSNLLLNVIKEKHGEYKKNVKNFPGLETVIFFKLVSNLYSTSDFRHPIVTPTLVFMSQILTKARVRTRQDIAMGMLMVSIILDCTKQSRRFLPAALNFLLGMVYLSIPKRPVELLKILPPFQSTGPLSKLLAIASDNDEAKDVPMELLKSQDLLTTHISLDFKVRVLNTSFKLIADAFEIVGENVGVNFLALPFLELFERLPLEVYPQYVQNNLKSTQAVLKGVADKPLVKLTASAKKPKVLRLLEPRIETVYDDKRRPKLTQEKEERVKLIHKVRRETKGAIREIRRDTQFLQKVRLQEQMQSDAERKEKVKRIYQEASVQQGELNEFARAKKSKKF